MKENEAGSQKKNKIEFRRDKDGNLYAVKNGKTIGQIGSTGDRRS